MKMELSRDQSFSRLGPIAATISEHAAFHLSQILETLGVSEFHPLVSQCMSGPILDVPSVKFFDGVPDEIRGWALKTAIGVSQFMYAFGMLGITIRAENDQDESALQSAWNSVMASQQRQKPAVREWGMMEQERLSVASPDPQEETPEEVKDNTEDVAEEVITL